jgi:hypothetical protein
VDPLCEGMDTGVFKGSTFAVLSVISRNKTGVCVCVVERHGQIQADA